MVYGKIVTTVSKLLGAFFFKKKLALKQSLLYKGFFYNKGMKNIQEK